VIDTGPPIDWGESVNRVDEGPIRVEVTPPLPVKFEPARAKGDVRSLITPNDYPEAARRREETGAVRVKLEIGASGSVTGCSVIASSGSALLDLTTCKVLKSRARFAPARDSSGQAVNDSYVTPRIVWTIEGNG
jgi:protein TonB